MLTHNHPINRLHNDMRQVFDLFGFQRDEQTSRMPAICLWEENDELTLQAEVPGMKLEDLEIFISEGNHLSLKGERQMETEEKSERKWHRRENCLMSFHRELTLPFEIDAGKVEAKLTNGILTITMPKSEAVKPHRIEIKTS